MTCVFLPGGLGCASRQVVPVPTVVEPPPPVVETCRVISGSPARAGTLRVVLLETVAGDAAPCPTNEAEEIVFRHLYETLVRVDCEGNVRPGLAATWESRDSGRIWTFTLRPHASWSDGTPMTAEDVALAWKRASSRSETPGRVSPWDLVRPDSVRTLGTNMLAVHLTGGRTQSPALFAHSWLAVARPASPGAWPLGSGPYRVRDESTSWSIVLDPNSADLDSTQTRAVLKFNVHEWSDPRDLLDHADLLLLASKDQADYASAVREFRVLPLAWSRMIVLLPSADPMELEPGGWRPFREALAGHVLLSDASPAAGFAPYPGAESRCDAKIRLRASETTLPHADPDSVQVAYREGDADAEQVAMRVGGLFPVASDAPVTIALPETDFGTALHRGGHRAYVVTLRRSFPDPCLDSSGFARGLDWLGARFPRPEDKNNVEVELQQVLVPLVMTRRQLAIRRGVVGVRQEWDGTVLLDRAGWSAEAVP